MALIDVFEKELTEKGWLAFSSLYFDNAMIYNIFNTRGYIAYSKSNQVFMTFDCLDSTDSSKVESYYVAMDNNYTGMQQTIVFAGVESFQRFSLAQYSHYRFYEDSQDETPYPTIPTKEQLDALSVNPDTGLYDGYDEVHIRPSSMFGREIQNETTYTNERKYSTIPLYDRDLIGEDKYSGAIIDGWKMFYKNHDKFVKLLNDAHGITDAM